MSNLDAAIPDRDVQSMHAPARVQAILRRERARADRTSRELSLVVVQLQEGERRVLDRVARLLLSRVRLTDEVGWFSEDQLCVVLPDTGSVGACCFSRNVCDTAKENSLRILCSIYTYPSQKSDGGGGPEGGSEERNRLAPLFEQGGKADRRMEQVRRAVKASAAAGAEDELARQGIVIEPLEKLMIERLPMWKRVFDVIGAVAGLVFGTPIMFLSVALIKLTSSGPILFRQERAGLGGKPFSIYKFRTMVMNAEDQKEDLRKSSEQDGPAFKMTSDPRVTPLGRYLRITSFDEFPQFWNVLMGNMSLVGPRPLPIEESAACSQWHRARLDVTPGLTCIWQVRGRSRVTFDEWMRMDMEYIRRRTLWHDLKLLLLTIPAVLLRRGAH